MFVFDMDGTLTSSRQKIDLDFCDWFKDYFKDKEYCIVTGSDIVKVREQLDKDITENAKFIFACSGNYVYSKDKVISVNEFYPEEILIEKLGNIIVSSKCSTLTGNHIERRNGLVNFSVVGRNCNSQQREQYYKWDREHKERVSICEELRKSFSDLSFEIGGEISIDIYPKGKDKSQILQYLEEYSIFFFGDGIEPDKNDWSLAQALTGESKSFKVRDWIDTKKKLTELL
jgi:phosphomannomutase